jgi:dolichol-phosphate mannosyltransferase
LKVYFVIPAYNEADNLPRLISNLSSTMATLGYEYQTVLVDDGSSDGTAEVARRLGGSIDVLSQPNQGPGAAFRNGFRHALTLARDEDLIITLEADNTSDLSILPRMIEALQGQDAVLASVYAPGGGLIGTSPLRKFLSWGANLMLVLALGTPHIHTYSSFFRVYRPQILRRAQFAFEDQLLVESGFVCMVELLIKLLLIGCRFVEVPMVLDGLQRSGKSKMRILRTIKGYGRVLWNYWQGYYNPKVQSLAEPTPVVNRP